MLRQSIFDNCSFSFLARAAVAVLALWIPLILVAACVPIPADPTSVQTIPTDSTTDRTVPTGSTTDRTISTDITTDRDVLVAFYHATNGDNWLRSDNWQTDAPIGRWYGVVADSGDRVIGLNLSRNGLSGAIPPELGNLIYLESLNLSGNELSGSIPPELVNLIYLELLWAGGNRLSGEIPPEFGKLTSLKSLDFDSNHLSGTIPPDLGKLTDLDRLGLGTTSLVGQFRLS